MAKSASVIQSLLLLFCFIAPDEGAGSCMVSAKQIPLRKHERIVGFALRLRGANFVALPKLPKCWNLVVYNATNEQPQWYSVLSGSVSVGAAALDPSFFNSFAEVRKESTSFDAELSLEVTSDFVRTRKIRLTKSQLLIAQ